MGVPVSPVLKGLFLTVVLLAVSCLLICAFLAFDKLAFGPAFAPPNPQIVDSKAEVESFIEWLSEVDKEVQRWRVVYLPLITLMIAAAAGRFSTEWSWTWLVAIVAISPVLAMVVASNGATLGLGFQMAMLHSVVAVLLATVLAWSRRRRGLGAAVATDRHAGGSGA